MRNEGSRWRWRLVSIAGTLLIPIAWWLVKELAQVPDRYLPSIGAVVEAINDIDPNLLIHIEKTVTRLIVGFIGGTILGICLGILFSRYLFIEKFLSPSVHALRAVPSAATVPFFLLWFGFAESGRYLLVFLAVGLNVAVASSQILSHHSRAHLAFFHSFGIPSGALPLRYSLPRVLEEILPTLRYSLTVAIGAVTVAELLGAQEGLGYLIQTGRSTFSFQLMFLAIIVIGIVASLMDFALRVIWKRMIYWRQK